MFESAAARNIRKAIEKAALSLAGLHPSSEEYTTVCQNLTRLANTLTAVSEVDAD